MLNARPVTLIKVSIGLDKFHNDGVSVANFVKSVGLWEGP